MTNIEAELRKYQSYTAAISDVEEEIKEILQKKMIISEQPLRPPSLDKPKVTGGETSDPVFLSAQKLVDIYSGILKNAQTRLCDLYFLRGKIVEMVDKAGLTDVEREYIKCRYFKNLNAAETAAQIGYSEDYSKEIKKKALLKIQPFLHQ